MAEAINISTLQALSIRQPWCHRILNCGKDIENRSWTTKFRGKVLIHAAKTFDGDSVARNSFIIGPNRFGPDSNKFGGIVGIMKITDCVDSSLSSWFQGPYGFVFKNARPLSFIPCKGMLGFFKPDISAEYMVPV